MTLICSHIHIVNYLTDKFTTEIDWISRGALQIDILLLTKIYLSLLVTEFQMIDSNM